MSYLKLTAASAAPSAATDGSALRKGNVPGFPDQGFTDGELDSVVLWYRATVTAGQTATSILQIWVYYAPSGGTADWYPLGPSPSTTDTDRGKLNANASSLTITEIATDKLNFCQVINLPGGAERIYLRETSGGSGFASQAYLQKGWGV